MGAFDDAPLVEAEDRETWRAWLEANHAIATGVWLVGFRAASGRPVLDYGASVEEALCFGWVDSRGEKVDEWRSRLYFAPRRPQSGWSGSNKERVERLMVEGRMAPAGLAAVERAKANGTWTILDAVERLEVPPDLATALAAHPPAAEEWVRFPPSARRQMLAWIVTAKRADTRAARIAKTAALAQRGERADQPRPRT